MSDSQITGNSGLYYVCYKLSCMGWNVMPTARNARGIDIIAYNSDGSKFIGVQVKSLSKKNPVPLGKSIENDKIMGDFWIIVTDVTSEQPKAFILKPDEVKKGALRGGKEGRFSYWLRPTVYENPLFKGKWKRIGNGKK